MKRQKHLTYTLKSSTKAIPITRHQAEFLLMNDGIAIGGIFCKGYEEDDRNFTQIFKEDIAFDGGKTEKHWYNFQIWLDI